MKRNKWYSCHYCTKLVFIGTNFTTRSRYGWRGTRNGRSMRRCRLIMAFRHSRSHCPARGTVWNWQRRNCWWYSPLPLTICLFITPGTLLFQFLHQLIKVCKINVETKLIMMKTLNIEHHNVVVLSCDRQGSRCCRMQSYSPSLSSVIYCKSIDLHLSLSHSVLRCFPLRSYSYDDNFYCKFTNICLIHIPFFVVSFS